MQIKNGKLGGEFRILIVENDSLKSSWATFGSSLHLTRSACYAAILSQLTSASSDRTPATSNLKRFDKGSNADQASEPTDRESRVMCPFVYDLYPIVYATDTLVDTNELRV